MRNRLSIKLAVVFLGLAVSMGAQATVLLGIDTGGWTIDAINNRWHDTGIPVQQGDASDATELGGWAFTLGVAGQLSISDGIDRDSYRIEVLNTGTNSMIFSGITAQMVGTPAWSGGGAIDALLNDAWVNIDYHGLQLLLGPGSYNVKVWLEDLDFDDAPANKVPVAGVGLRVDTTQIPEPHALILFGTGLVMLARRRRGKQGC